MWLLRLMVDHYSYVLPNKSEIFCKIRVYLTAVFPLISTACIVLASIDRCLLTSTSMKWRRWTTIKMAYILVIISIIIGIISPSHMLVFYGFYVVSGSSPSCSSQPGVYGAFISIFLVVWFTCIPYIIMFISSCTTFVHIRASRNRVMPVQQQNHRRTDRSLITLVFIQVILSMILLAMRTVFIAHLYLTRDVVKDRTTRSVESFMSQLGTVFYYINYAKSFYLCTLTSKLFRDAFWKQCEIFWKSIAHPQRETTVVPLSATALTKKRSIQPILSPVCEFRQCSSISTDGFVGTAVACGVVGFFNPALGVIAFVAKVAADYAISKQDMSIIVAIKELVRAGFLRLNETTMQIQLA
ncbi:hypothetical protein I4U23_011784 [Adineta vaga]|nr:hypothetical protein I4U23_011784 [Adineta vaga]